MQVRTNTWHYRLYRFGFVRDNPRVPRETNLCRYVQRIAFGVPARLSMYALQAAGYGIIIVIALCLAAICCALVGIANVFTIGAGYGVVYPNDGNLVGNQIPFRIPVGSKKLRLAWLTIPTLVLGGIVSIIMLLNGGEVPAGLLTTIGYWAGGIVLAVGAVVALIAFFTSETWRISSEYLKARKSGICPEIEIIEAV